METAVLELPKVEPADKKRSLPEAEELNGEKIFLSNVSWQTYESLLKDQPEVLGLHFFYDNGDLEIMTESCRHGKVGDLLERVVTTFACELEIDFISAGETTFKRKDRKKGFEGDGSYYFEHAMLMRRKDQIDLNVDPPPELVLEVDITLPSLPKFPIYAGVGVAEIWRYDGTNVVFHRLQNKDYIEIAQSVCLPGVTSKFVLESLEATYELTRSQRLKLVRGSVKKNLPPITE